MCKWEKRPRAAKPIDTDWKTAGRTPVKRKATNVGEVVAVSVVENMDSDGEGRNDEESASERSEDEEEFIHIQEGQEVEADEGGEQLRRWPHDGTDLRMEQRRNTTYQHKRPRVQQEIGSMYREVQGGGQETSAKVWTNATNTAKVAVEEEARGKTRTTIRHNKRNARRQRMENTAHCVQNQPGDLVILEGHTHDGAKEKLDHIPLHMRAVLGKTSSRKQDESGGLS